MVTELVTFKMEHDFLNEIDQTIKTAGFQNRTEFIRTALREKLNELQKDRYMKQFLALKGKATKKVSDEKLDKIREEAFNDLIKKNKLN